MYTVPAPGHLEAGRGRFDRRVDEDGREGGIVSEPEAASPERGGADAPSGGHAHLLGADRAGWPYPAVLLGVFAAFLAAVRPVLTPPVLYLLLVYLAWPLADGVLVRRMVAVATVLAAVWVVHVTGLLLAPFVLAAIVAYIVDPAVDWLQEKGLPRSLAIGVLALPLLGVLALLVFVVFPALAQQVSQLISNVPAYVEVVEGWIGDLRQWALDLELAGVNEQTLPEARDIDAQIVMTYLERWRSQFAVGVREMVLGIGRGIGTGLTVLGYVILTPLLTYYILRDWDRIRDRLRAVLPGRRRERIVSFARDYDRLLNRYLRGQLLLATVVGVFVGVGLWVVDFPYALLVGIVAGAFNVVPYLGFAIGAGTAVLIALFTGPVLVSLLKVAGVFTGQQVVEGVLGPYIVGESVGLHPVWVLLALVLFSFFFGFVGLLIAVPLAVLIKLGIEEATGRGSREAA